VYTYIRTGEDYIRAHKSDLTEILSQNPEIDPTQVFLVPGLSVMDYITHKDAMKLPLDVYVSDWARENHSRALNAHPKVGEFGRLAVLLKSAVEGIEQYDQYYFKDLEAYSISRSRSDQIEDFNKKIRPALERRFSGLDVVHQRRTCCRPKLIGSSIERCDR